ncbi:MULTISPECIES: hypothetical protein [unclassified Pseudofrankia]|uniref:hypothetical protein n=1 Tax=unclassified Pseudofrankia TaxID=2994372 RepID=UPI0008D92E64|nr:MULTISPECIES: hypothetical protein [unclassified Pseudofrankia]MDT3445126.1 hypothetical protein [Pseudofrankia sp. BMG5.37]OHV56588.1 hypothetical protein BCD48_43775 [Pseudofrankia sp. BMG5.36]
MGAGVLYRLTDRGRRLGPALAEFRQWGLDELLPPAADGDTPAAEYDLSYAVPADLPLAEAYEWHLDSDVYSLRIDRTRLTVETGSTPDPALVLRTTRAFMHRWVAGETTWDRGRRDGHVEVTGPADAWDRMLLATAYPGRPANLLTRLRAQPTPTAQAPPASTPAHRSHPPSG